MLRLGCQGWVTTPSMESQFRSNYYFVPNKQVLEILGREIFKMYNQLHPGTSVSPMNPLNGWLQEFCNKCQGGRRQFL